MTGRLRWYHWFCPQRGSSLGPCSHSSGCRCNLHTQKGQRLRHAWKRDNQQQHLNTVKITQFCMSQSSSVSQSKKRGKSSSYMALMLSVRLASKVRNCLPFLVNPRTWAPEQTKIFSCGVPTAPPRSILAIFCPGSVLNTGWNRESHFFAIRNRNSTH